MTFEVIKNSSRLIITVHNGRITRAESPTHPCFRPTLLVGAPWDDAKANFEKQGFTVHKGC